MTNNVLIADEFVVRKIFTIRKQNVMLDFDLAQLYDVDTKRLKQAVRRNINRFPSDFMFELTPEEYSNLRTQFVSSSWGGARYMPFAFTEQGVAMLSSVLSSDRAIEVNIAIIRTFVLIRKHALTYQEIAQKLKEIDLHFDDVHEAINYLLKKDKMQENLEKRSKIGFKKH